MVKEIIIDGVDVSECQNYNLKTKKCTIPCWIGYIKCTGLTCSDIKDCYFKRNKRTEQKLAKALACIDKCVSDFYHEIGTPYYEELLKSAKELGLIAEAKDE